MAKRRDHFLEAVFGLLTILTILFITALVLTGCVPAEGPHDQEAMHVSNFFPGFVLGSVAGFILIFFVINKHVQRERAKGEADAVCLVLNANPELFDYIYPRHVEIINEVLNGWVIAFNEETKEFQVYPERAYSFNVK